MPLMAKLKQIFRNLSDNATGDGTGSKIFSFFSRLLRPKEVKFEAYYLHTREFFISRAHAYTPEDLHHMSKVIVQSASFDIKDVERFAKVAKKRHGVDPRENHDLKPQFESKAHDPVFYNKILICGIYAHALAELESNL